MLLLLLLLLFISLMRLANRQEDDEHDDEFYNLGDILDIVSLFLFFVIVYVNRYYKYISS
jgi:hypothetical protein